MLLLLKIGIVVLSIMREKGAEVGAGAEVGIEVRSLITKTIEPVLMWVREAVMWRRRRKEREKEAGVGAGVKVKGTIKKKKELAIMREIGLKTWRERGREVGVEVGARVEEHIMIYKG